MQDVDTYKKCIVRKTLTKSIVRKTFALKPLNYFTKRGTHFDWHLGIDLIV